MVEERELTILKKSIAMLNGFSERIESVNSGREFIAIHQRNIATIQKIAVERNSKYLNRKLAEYPPLSEAEVNDFIRTKKKEVSMLIFVFAYFKYLIVDGLIRLIKTKGSTSKMIKSKILKIENLNIDVWKVIENPYLEELYP